MASCHVLILGDLTVSFEEELRHLLHNKDNEVLRSFFAKVGFALRSEFGELPIHQQNWFPHFTTLIDLLSKVENIHGTPILKFTLLCVCQIGQFIRYGGMKEINFDELANTDLDTSEKVQGHIQKGKIVMC